MTKDHGKIIGDEPCPDCRSRGRDSTGNHLLNFESGFKYCNRCHYKENSLSWDETDEEMITLETAKKLPIKALRMRGITKQTAEFFRIRTELGENGEDAKYYYPVTCKGKFLIYKTRDVLTKEKKDRFRKIGPSIKGVEVDLFGQYQCKGSGKRLLIVGGQDDAAAAKQMLTEYYKTKGWDNVEHDVVGVINGESASQLGWNLEFIMGYDEILLCFDNDEMGAKCTKDAARLIGPRAKVVKITENDPNDVLNRGKQKEFISAYFNAQVWTPDELLSVEDVFDEATEMPSWGRLWPWPSLNKLTYGRRNGEGIYIGAGTKIGKTEALSELVHHIITTEGKPVLLFKFEQTPGETIKAIAGKECNKRFNMPDGDFTQEELTAAVTKLKGKVWQFKMNLSELGNNSAPWERMKPIIRHATEVLGVEDVFIDPITQLTDGMEGGDTDSHLRLFSNELAGFAKEYNFFYYCFCHLKSPLQGKTHEEGARPKPAQFRGSRAMQEKTKLMLGIQRDLYAEDPVVANTSTFHLLLNSSFGKAGSFEVYYDSENGSYLEEKIHDIAEEIEGVEGDVY